MLESMREKASRAMHSRNESEEQLLSDDGRAWTAPQPRQSSLATSYLAIAFVTLLCCISAFLGALAGDHWLKNVDNATLIAKTSWPSPVTKDVDIAYNTVRFNGSLMNENVYRQPASPEVDAAWEALGVGYRSLVVPESDAERIGLAKDQVKISDKYGGGYPANVEGLHHLHCLNLVRQSLYYNYDYYHKRGEGAFTNSDSVVQKHVSHCLDIIRQELMCTIDIGVLGQVWYQPESSETPQAFVDFNTRHTCRNFEDVRRWAEERQMPEDVPNDFLEPPKEGDTIYSSIP
ncbi:hypothetical protein MBLNU230_g6791t1 [Neophaeotheca triangularis]